MAAEEIKKLRQKIVIIVFRHHNINF